LKHSDVRSYEHYTFVTNDQNQVILAITWKTAECFLLALSILFLTVLGHILWGIKL
jgi:hypothetical protein